MSIHITRWPILIFHLAIWKLQITTDLFRDVAENMTFEYVGLYIYWSGKTLFKVKLYDTWQRIEDRTHKTQASNS